MIDPGDNFPIVYYWLGALALGVLAAWALFQFVASVRRDRLLADLPLVKIRSAAQGYVKVAGHAKPAGESPTAAPLSARPCVWWSYEVAEKIRNRKDEDEGWHTVDRGTSIEPFVIEDADGECLVGPINAEITPTSYDRWYGERPVPGCLPTRKKGLLGSENYRYTERLLKVGDFLSVVGELRSNSEIATADAATGALLREWKADQAALLTRFDKNHDGRIDGEEWEAARRAAAAESETRALNSRIVRTSVIGQSSHGEPFLIAALDSPQLVRRERFRAALYLSVGLACMGLCAGVVDWALAAPTVHRTP